MVTQSHRTMQKFSAITIHQDKKPKAETVTEDTTAQACFTWEIQSFSNTRFSYFRLTLEFLGCNS